MIIVVGKWKRKLARLAALMAVIVVFAAAVPSMVGLFHEKVPVFSGWMQDDEIPSGNPMRVEQIEPGSDFAQKIDQFVIKMQGFYLEENE